MYYNNDMYGAEPGYHHPCGPRAPYHQPDPCYPEPLGHHPGHMPPMHPHPTDHYAMYEHHRVMAEMHKQQYEHHYQLAMYHYHMHMSRKPMHPPHHPEPPKHPHKPGHTASYEPTAENPDNNL